MMDSSTRDKIHRCAADATSEKELTDLFQHLTHQLEESRKHLNLLEKAIQSDYDSILITDVGLESPGPRIVYVNDGFTRMTGYTREEAIGQTPRMLQGPKTDPAVLNTLRDRLQQGQSFFGHTVNYRKDGSEFINQWDIHPLFNEEGELSWWVSYQHDITDRKKSELTLLDVEKEFDDLTEESKTIHLDLDMEGNIMASNKLFRDLIGRDTDQLRKVKIWDLFVEEERDAVKEAVHPGSEIFTTASKPFHLLTGAGQKVAISVQGKILSAIGQEILRLSIVNRSAQTRILQALEKRAKEMVDLFPEKHHVEYRCSVESQGVRYSTVSREAQAVLGISEADLLRKGVEAFVHPEDRAQYRAFQVQVLSGKSMTAEYRLLSDPSTPPLEVIDYAKPVTDPATGEVTEIKGRISTEIASA